MNPFTGSKVGGILHKRSIQVFVFQHGGGQKPPENLNFAFMSSIRQQKFETLIQQEFGKYFREEARTVCMGAMVTATGVRVAPDLSFARVYLSIFGAPDAKAVFEHINGHKPQIRYAMGKRLGKSLRRIPEFDFEIDDSLDYSDKIDKLLKGK